MTSSTKRAAYLLPLLLFSVAGCSKPKTVVLVSVQGTTGGIVQLHVTLNVGPQGTEFLVPPTPGEAITLPTDFTIEMEEGRRGALELVLSALDSSQVAIATGGGRLASVDVGTRNDVTVVLTDLAIPPPDGGEDGGQDADPPDAPADAGDDAEPPDAEADAGDDGDSDGAVGADDAGGDGDGADAGEADGGVADGADAADDVPLDAPAE